MSSKKLLQNTKDKTKSSLKKISKTEDVAKRRTKQSEQNPDIEKLIKSDGSSRTPAKNAKIITKRSLSLSRQNVPKAQENQRKSQSTDRSNAQENQRKSQSTDRSNAKTDSLKNSNKNKSIENKHQNVILKSSHVKEKSKLKSTNISNPNKKKSTHSTESSIKSNIQIAKSFVENVAKKSKTDQPIKRSKDDDSSAERPRTSVLRKDTRNENFKHESDPSSANNVEVPKLHRQNLKVSDDEKDEFSYEEDFEEYMSDFEESYSTSDSVSSGSSRSTISDNEEESLRVEENKPVIKNPSVLLSKSIASTSVKKKERNKEKTFLQISDHYFLSSDYSADNQKDKKLMKPSHSFINFQSALEEERKEKSISQVLKRASELLDMISLDFMAFDIIDIPPMKYDTYIRLFGSSNAKQMSVQTEVYEDDETETDEIELSHKWTQNPPHDSLGVGADDDSNFHHETDKWKRLLSFQNAKLSNFLQKSSNVVLTLLNEEFPVLSKTLSTKQRNELFYSSGYYTLSPPNFLKCTPVIYVCSSDSGSYLLTIHDGIISVPSISDERGIICIWNTFDDRCPVNILVSHSQPTCASFDPGGNDLVIAGMVDGSVALWDLHSDLGRTESEEGVQIKSPAYNTAAVLGVENCSCIVAVRAARSSPGRESAPTSDRAGSSKNFHILTLEEMGIINVWVVIEVLKQDFSGLETDLGIAPGGKFRLIKSAFFNLSELNVLQEVYQGSLRTFSFQLLPNDPNRILVTTDAGAILHVNRHGGSTDPRFYSNNLDLSNEIRLIDCSPHDSDLFLVACTDGSGQLYNVKLAHPLLVFPQVAKGESVLAIQWSPTRPVEFFVLGDSSTLHLWNLAESRVQPARSCNFPDAKVTWFHAVQFSCSKPSEKLVNVLLSFEDGETEVHKWEIGPSPGEYASQLDLMKHL